jgi:nicotinamidase-related amidase
MSKIALLIVDMLKDFLEESGTLYCGNEARAIIPFVQNKIQEARDQGGLIVFIRDAHAPNDLEFERFPRHCVKGTPGAEILDELDVRPEDPQVEKTRFSGFFRTPLEEIIAREGIEEAHVVGVCTSICVMDTVSDLRNRDIRTIVFREGVADFDPEAHAFALKRMEKTLGAEVV